MNNHIVSGVRPNPELLSPAGSPGCALAAFEAGADAIYAGLSKFNARERGENFTPENMAQIIEYAHKLKRKVYITLNTLVKESELAEVAETLALLEEMQPDALLVQDLGIIRMAREYFPKLALHASTQMGFHNSAGLEIAEKLGISRVVLERQMTLEEIALVRKSTKLELEVFIHGALCASLSGACFFSSYLGGYSGNRGKCKQPCRRRYFSKNGNGFFFSPQDLCTIELLPQLRELGIDSLKIEGRLKQPDFVRQTVGAYRMLLDAPAAEFREHLGEARNMLSKGCGRKWSLGFYTTESASTLISHDSLGAAGQLCGNVNDLRDNGFGFVTSKRLFLGDRLRVQPQSGDEGSALTVTKMFIDNAPTRKALPGQQLFVLCDKPVAAGGLVFKIGESFSDYAKELAALPIPRKKLNLALKLTSSQIEVKVENGIFPNWKRKVALQSADSRPVTAETLHKEFSAADSDVFALGEFKCEIGGNFFLPSSELKSLRREFWNEVKENLSPESVFRDSAVGLERFRKAYQSLKPAGSLPEHLQETVAMKPNGAEPGNRKAIRACSIFDFNKLTGEVILPEFCPEGKLESVKRAIQSAVASGIKRFRIGSLYALTLLKPHQKIEIIASTPLPVANSMTALELSRLGVSRVTAHIELEKESIEALRDKSVLVLELYRYGRPALLITRAKIPMDGEFRDDRGNGFVVRFDRRDGLTRLYPQKVHSIPRLPGLYDFYDLQNAHWNSRETGTFNFDGDWF
ncbi:MAG: U32 family peptidase [Victivallales bacterium]|jgi:putative protease|nr:U32 family peptidase [Victivallales bacterium]